MDEKKSVLRCFRDTSTYYSKIANFHLDYASLKSTFSGLHNSVPSLTIRVYRYSFSWCGCLLIPESAKYGFALCRHAAIRG